ncbi:MAG: hypothetical protein WHS65_14265 [Melioribacteraceae bacterium]
MELETKLKINEYINIFCKNDFYNAVYYCHKWNGTNGIYFREKGPEDFVMYILGRIAEGKRKVYLDDYNKFKCSVYYHLEHEMLTYFCCRKKKVAEEFPNYTSVIESNIVSFNDEEYFENCNDDDKIIISTVEKNELKELLLSLFDPDEETEDWFVLEGYLSGKKREEIAEDLGLNVDKVTNIKKRIIRKLSKNKNLIRKGLKC